MTKVKSNIRICITNTWKFLEDEAKKYRAGDNSDAETGNEGKPISKWIDLPVNDNFKSVMDEIGIDDNYEDWFISDYESTIGLKVDKHADIYELNAMAKKLNRLNKTEKAVIKAMCSQGGYDIEEALDTVSSDCYMCYPGCHDVDKLKQHFNNDITDSISNLVYGGEPIELVTEFYYSSDLDGYVKVW